MARKSFKCSKCSRSFSMAAHLGRHMNTIHGKVKEVVPCLVELERFSDINSFLSTPLRKDIQVGPAFGPAPPSTGASAYSLFRKIIVVLLNRVPVRVHCADINRTTMRRRVNRLTESWCPMEIHGILQGNDPGLF